MPRGGPVAPAAAGGAASSRIASCPAPAAPHTWRASMRGGSPRCSAQDRKEHGVLLVLAWPTALQPHEPCRHAYQIIGRPQPGAWQRPPRTWTRPAAASLAAPPPAQRPPRPPHAEVPLLRRHLAGTGNPPAACCVAAAAAAAAPPAAAGRRRRPRGLGARRVERREAARGAQLLEQRKHARLHVRAWHAGVTGLGFGDKNLS